MFVYQLEKLIPHTRYLKEYQMKINEKQSFNLSLSLLQISIQSTDTTNE